MHAVRAGRVLHGRCAEIKQNLSRIHAFSREILRAFERRSRAISVPNAALTRQQLSLTSGVLRNARGARWPSFSWAVRRTQTKFAMHSRVFSQNFARFRTPKSRNLGNKCSADSATTFADIRRVAQRTRCTLAEFCMGGKLKSNKICHAFARFLAKFSMRTFERRSRAISVTNAALTRQQISLTSCVLRNARGARWPSFAWAVS